MQVRRLPRKRTATTSANTSNATIRTSAYDCANTPTTTATAAARRHYNLNFTKRHLLSPARRPGVRLRRPRPRRGRRALGPAEPVRPLRRGVLQTVQQGARRARALDAEQARARARALRASRARVRGMKLKPPPRPPTPSRRVLPKNAPLAVAGLRAPYSSPEPPFLQRARSMTCWQASLATPGEDRGGGPAAILCLPTSALVAAVAGEGTEAKARFRARSARSPSATRELARTRARTRPRARAYEIDKRSLTRKPFSAGSRKAQSEGIPSRIARARVQIEAQSGRGAESSIDPAVRCPGHEVAGDFGALQHPDGCFFGLLY